MELPILSDEQILEVTKKVQSIPNKFISDICSDTFMVDKVSENRYLEAWMIMQGLLRSFGRKEHMTKIDIARLEEFSMLLFAKYSETKQCLH